MPSDTFVLGAVAYDPKVVTIWDGFKVYFTARGLPFDYVLFTTYEAQVAAHLKGQLDAAWNSPLAWVQTRRAAPDARAVAMRDTDCDLSSVILVRTDGPQTIDGLRKARVGTGAADSPQATLIPLLALAEGGLEPGRDCEVVRHDLLLGKHGDHIGGERDAVKALLAGRVDAACVLDANHLAFSRDGTLPAGRVRVLLQTPTYDHCNFTVFGNAREADFTRLLLKMSWDDLAVRPLLELEGLKSWRPGRTSGYALLERAVARFGMP
jgi:ABC-type phosphate/phosphonate transport system substrate-binding protein